MSLVMAIFSRFGAVAFLHFTSLCLSCVTSVQCAACTSRCKCFIHAYVAASCTPCMQLISFILAGRDTTSSAFTWFFWILSSRPDVKPKILDELGRVRVRNGKVIGETYGFEELREMQYLHAALSETMRLYPPVAVDTKACLKDGILPDGTVIKKNWFISYHTYAMGRMERIWGKDCHEFKPERWMENRVYRAESPFNAWHNHR